MYDNNQDYSEYEKEKSNYGNPSDWVWDTLPTNTPEGCTPIDKSTEDLMDGIDFNWEKVSFEPTPLGTSDGSTANYYQFPDGVKELQDLISYKNMNAQIAEIIRACYRYGEVSHSSKLRDAKKMKFYAEAEIERLEKYGKETGEL